MAFNISGSAKFLSGGGRAKVRFPNGTLLGFSHISNASFIFIWLTLFFIGPVFDLAGECPKGRSGLSLGKKTHWNKMPDFIFTGR